MAKHSYSIRKGIEHLDYVTKCKLHRIRHERRKAKLRSRRRPSGQPFNNDKFGLRRRTLIENFLASSQKANRLAKQARILDGKLRLYQDVLDSHVKYVDVSTATTTMRTSSSAAAAMTAGAAVRQSKQRSFLDKSAKLIFIDPRVAQTRPKGSTRDKSKTQTLHHETQGLRQSPQRNTAATPVATTKHRTLRFE